MAGAFLANVAANLVAKLGEYLFAPIGRQFGYVLLHKSYVEDLENGVAELEMARERVQGSVNGAVYDGKVVHTDVRDWLDSAKEEAEEAENLLKRDKIAKYACFHGWLPNPLVRHAIGEKVKKMTQVIRGLYEKSRNSNFQKVYHENTPIGIVTAATSTARSVDNKEDVLESRAKIMEDVMKAIVDDNVGVIGVHGLGGVGKSKLLEDIERRVKEERLFDVVVTAKVSRNPDIKEIQGEIAYALGLKLTNDEPVRRRADSLCKRLESDSKKKILIILDNLWKKLELKEVGIPCEDDNKVRGCKLLLTSRYRDVLRMEMGSDQQFRVNELEDGEARKLFEKTIGERINDLEVRCFIDGVVQKCGGLPLLIIPVAKRLKHGDLAEWRNALTNIEGSDVKSIVELSYNDLKDERIKSLFLICALASGRILFGHSLMYGIGLGLFKKFSKTIRNAFDRMEEDLHSLQDSSLLLYNHDAGEIRMHDIFVDESISIASTKWNALVAREDYGFKDWSKDELTKCTAISFPFVGIDELPEKLDCPNLRMLLLLEDNSSRQIPKSFFESMEKLQVLDMTGLSFTSLPSSIEFLKNLKSLCLDDCHMEDMTILGKLKGLQSLSIWKSSIARLPKEIGGLTELRILNLTGCSGLKIIEPGVLGSLVKLELLSMTDSFDQWEDQDQAPRSNASLAELNNMKNLSTLFISVPHSANLLGDLPFGNLTYYNIYIGDVWDWSVEEIDDRILKLKLDSGNLLDEVWVQRCLRMTQNLHLDGLQDGNDSINDLCVDGFQELKHLRVQNSPSLQYVVHSAEDIQCNAFTKLESLFLENLNNLEKIYHGCLASESFSKLNIVKVDNCCKIKYLFPFYMMRIFLQLKEIEISRCHLMQQIIGDAKADEDGDELPILKEIWNSQSPSDMSHLKFLKVVDCSFLLSIIPSNLLVKLQNLEAITIERCHLIREVFNLEGLTASGDVEILSQLTKLILSDLPSLGHICSNNPRRMFCFRNLTTLKVQNCDNLRFLFSSSMFKALEQIKTIEIASCTLMEEIMDVQEEESKEAATTYTLQFPLLTSLSLEKLPNLMTFSQGKYRIHCPSLIRLRISGCPKMTTFSSFEGKQQVVTAYTGLQQDSGLSSPALFNQNVLFPSLEELTLLSLCGLRRIWQNELPEESFCKLSSITVRDCENLSHIFPSTLIERFQSLKMIEVVQCISLEALMEHDAVNSKKRQKGLLLSDLKEVKLWHLPRLNAILTSSTKATFYFPNLTNVSLRNCHNLRYLFTNDTARTLHELEMLDISGCNNMREVVAMEEGEERKLKAMKFSHLHTLNLCSLKSLISFSSGSCAFEFPSLRNLSILECTELKTFILRLSAPCVELMNDGDASFDGGQYSLFDKKVIFPKLENLRLTGVQSREFWENEIDYEYIWRLKVLEVKHCHNLLNVIPSFMWKRLLHYLESLTVESCNLIEGIYTLEGLSVMERVAERSSPLRELSLCDLPKLTYIWKNEDLLNLCLRNLTSVRVGKCPHLRSLFTMSMAKSLGQLRYLGLGGCGEMEYIVVREEEKPEEAADIIVFPQLVTLYLQNMPKLKNFCQGKYISEWPSLKEFTVRYCKAVEVIVGDTGCRKLESNVQTQQELLLVNKLITLQSLEAITIEKCQLIKEVFDLEGLTSSGEVKILLRLRELTLSDLPSLGCIWNKNPQRALCFRNLRALKVQNCENLRFLFSPSMAKALGQIKEIEIASCKLMEEIIDAQEEELEEVASSDALEFPLLISLSLEELPNLKTFSYQKYCIHCPSLAKLTISRCPKMMTFSSLEAKQWSITSDRGLQQAFDRINSGLSLPGFFNDKVLFPSLEELKLFSMCQLKKIWHNQLHGQSFCKLASLTVELCENLSHVFTSNSIDRLQSLNKIEVVGCPSLETLFDLVSLNSDEMQKPLVLSSLEKMKLLNLPRLIDILKSDCKLTLVFPSLLEVSVRCCHSLSYLFSSATARTLDKLAVLDVSCCNNMKGIIAMEEGTMKTVETFKFRNLSTLKLGDLKNLICFNSKSSADDGLHPLFDDKLIRLQNLEAITVERCQLIREVFDLEELTTSGDVKILWQLTTLTLSGLPRLEHIWNKNPRKALCFRNLKTLKVQNCESLRFLFSSSMAKALMPIKEIEIASCAMMEEIVYVQEEELEEAMTTDTVEFPLLTSLSLEELPNLKTFSYGKYYIHCLSLTRLTISGCPKMMTFSSFKGRQQSMTTDTSLQQAFGCINSSLSLLGFFNERVLFPSLEKLKLSSMCQIKRIWHNQLQGQSFCKLASLTIELCENLSHIFPSNSMDMLQSLNKIKAVGCPSLEALFEPISLGAEKRQKPLVLPALRELTLLNLSRLRDILKSDCKVTLAFPSLMEVKVRDCHSLPYLFSSGTAKTLDKLAVLDVSCCNNLRGIIAMEEIKGKTLETLKFHKLRTIKLDDLENLISFHLASCADDGLHPLFDEKVLFPSLEELKLSSVCQLKKLWHNQIHGQSFCKLASLTIKLCENLSHVFLSNIADRLPSLNKIEVVGCPSLEALFEPVSLDFEKRQKSLVLSTLREMTLLNLSMLRDILTSDCKVTLAFPSLMEVNVRCCHSLPYIFSSATAETLDKLAVLDVSCCNNLRGIIAMEEGKRKTVETFKFPHLTKLKLDDLKSLICFSLESCAGGGLHPLFDEKLAFLKLEELHVEGVQQKEIWNDKIHVESFCHIKVLKVKQCHNLINVIPSSMWKRLLHCMESLTVEKCQRLRNLFTMSMARSLGQLQYLGLGGCGEIEYIVAKEEEKIEEATDKIIIPQLVTLYLHNMPKLRSFYEGKHISEWPSLKEFTVEDCKAVKVILGDVSCRKLEGSVPTHQPLLLVEKIEFPDMKSMKISHMDNAERIWLDDLPSNAFSKLKTLVVEYCEKLSSIFSSYTMLTRFQNLEKINVTDCGSLEVVFHVQEFNFSEAPSRRTFQLKELVLKQLPKMKHVWSGLPQEGLTFECIECIKVNKCESLKILFPSSVAKSMTRLKELFVWDCGVEEIVVEEDGIGTSEGSLFFPRLTDLRLVELPKLKSFYRNSHTSTWPLLKKLKVRRCGKMRSFSFACECQNCQGTTTSENQAALFPFEKVIPHLEGLALAREDVAMIPQHYVFHNLKELDLACYHDENVAFLLLRRFPNLEVLSVRCSSFEEIFPEDSSGHGGATPCGDLTDMAKPLQELRNPNQLHLYDLPNLKRVWKDGSLMTEILKLIEALWVEECPRLPIILPSPISFQRLAYLEVEDCSGLVHMGTCSAATSLVHLTWLSLRNCGAMEDVVTDDGNGAGDISFPKLEELILDGLPSLESFSNTNRALRFPSLARIVVTKCPKMNIFCKGALRTPELDEVLLSKEDDERHWDGDLNTTIQTLYALNDPQRIQ